MPSRSQIRRYELYGEPSSPLAAEFVHVERIVDRSSRYDWTIAPHTHPEIFQVLLIDGGAVEITIDGQHQSRAGITLITVPSASAHAFRFASETEGWVLSIASALLGDARLAGLGGELAMLSGPATVTNLPSSDGNLPRLRWLLADLEARQAEPCAELPASTLALVGLALTLVQEVVDADAGAALAPGGRLALAQAFRKRVEAHFREHLPIADHAAALGATVPTLTRACRDAYGKPPGELLADRLALEAMRSLTYTSASAAAISDGLGFSDPAYFARWFRRRAGMTASAFRRDRAWLRPDGERSHDERWTAA